jgi:membrane protein involved in colicin uptake
VTAPDGAVDADESGIPAAWFPHSVKPDAASFEFVDAVPAYLKAHRTAEGSRYLDAKAATEKAAERQPQCGEHRAEVEARRAAVKQAYAERWAEWKKAAEQRRAEWKQARAERRAAMKAAGAERRAEWKARHQADRWNAGSDGERQVRQWHGDGERGVGERGVGERGDRGHHAGFRGNPGGDFERHAHHGDGHGGHGHR